jgi:hypothetical protein
MKMSCPVRRAQPLRIWEKGHQGKLLKPERACEANKMRQQASMPTMTLAKHNILGPSLDDTFFT